MNGKMNKAITWVSLVASLIVGAQMVAIALRGEAFCLNQGCAVVEDLIALSPFWFNLVGLFYFQTIFWMSLWVKNGRSTAFDWLSLLLLAGLAAEGVLLSFQIFVVQTFCSYCLIVFSLVLLLNVLSGKVQRWTGATLVVAIILIFSLLDFGRSQASPGKLSLDAGTFAVKTCSAPTKELYLIFSTTCPHCEEVMRALESCNSCTFHFNPVDQIESLDFPDIELRSSYTPEVNRMILALLGINEVPVLLANNPDGVSIIKGEQNIIRYTGQACIQKEPLYYLDSGISTEHEDLKVYRDQEDGCSVKIDCD